MYILALYCLDVHLYIENNFNERFCKGDTSNHSINKTNSADISQVCNDDS